MLAPICLFTYNRLSETIETIEALKNNYLASESDLIVFSDGPKNDTADKNVENVRNYIRGISGFKSINIIESSINKGLANSIISGVSYILENYEKVIVLEDDLISAPNFLNFMNQALDFYEDQNKIYSISGYTMDLPSLEKSKVDFYLGYRASSWGWGTWKNRWNKVCWEIKDHNRFFLSPIKHIRFLRGGSDLSLMLWRQMHGKIDSWAIRWCYHQFKNDLLTVFPSKSKVINIGSGDSATHTKKLNRFNVQLDTGNQKVFLFDQNPKINKIFVKEFRAKFSLYNRMKDKLIK
jgi:hypothetical protein